MSKVELTDLGMPIGASAGPGDGSDPRTTNPNRKYTNSQNTNDDDSDINIGSPEPNRGVPNEVRNKIISESKRKSMLKQLDMPIDASPAPLYTRGAPTPEEYKKQQAMTAKGVNPFRMKYLKYKQKYLDLKNQL